MSRDGVVPEELRRLSNRSGKQICPLCDNREVLVEHHLRGREIPNAEHTSNKANICPNCHHRVHLGLVVIEGWFTTSSGRKLFWHKQGHPSLTGEEAIPYIMGDNRELVSQGAGANSQEKEEKPAADATGDLLSGAEATSADDQGRPRQTPGEAGKDPSAG